MTQSFHMCLSVRGALNWNRIETKRNMKALFQNNGEKFPSVEALRNALMDELAKGNEVIPMGKCDNFDPKTGCRGHEKP